MVVSAFMPLDVILRESGGNSFAANWTQVELALTESKVGLGLGPVTRLPAVALAQPSARLPCGLPAGLVAP
jgi:hypothetical protein